MSQMNSNSRLILYKHIYNFKIMDNLDRHLINQVICYCIEQISIVTNNLGLKMMTMRIEV